MLRVITLSFLSVSSTALLGRVRPRITRPVNESAVFRLARTTHPLAIPANDARPAAAELRMERMLLLLARGPEQQTALDRLLADLQGARISALPPVAHARSSANSSAPPTQDLGAIAE
jgi:hypothetical protein